MKNRQYLDGLYGRIRSLTRRFLRLLNTGYEFFACKGDCLIINSWIEYRFGKLKHRNWGDELNVFIVEYLSQKKVVNRRDIFRNKQINYTVIGSLLPEWINDYTIIWGTGASHCKDSILTARPKKVCAVRGKLTRNLLLSNGIDCPEIYGDPALLLPIIYPKKICKKYKLGLICHIDDENHPDYKLFLKNNTNDVLKIRLRDYGDWSCVIDNICSCEVIASSSLHGLIVADAYGVPNVWLKSHVRLHGDEFKFLDYFSGVNRVPPIPILLESNSSVTEIVSNAKGYTPLKFDIKPLLDSCPFKQNWI